MALNACLCANILDQSRGSPLCVLVTVLSVSAVLATGTSRPAFCSSNASKPWQCGSGLTCGMVDMPPCDTCVFWQCVSAPRSLGFGGATGECDTTSLKRPMDLVHPMQD